MTPLEQLDCEISPREVLAHDFPSLGGELPIRGGWGYTMSEACIIDRNDPVVRENVPFDGVSLEYLFVEKRIYEEMIIFRPEGEKFAGIHWELVEQQVVRENDRVYDRLRFNITAFHDKDWEDLRNEWEGPSGYQDPKFDLAAHAEKRQQRMISISREFWFDITSFFGK